MKNSWNVPGRIFSLRRCRKSWGRSRWVSSYFPNLYTSSGYGRIPLSFKILPTTFPHDMIKLFVTIPYLQKGASSMAPLKIPVGISDFKKLREDGYYYIDACQFFWYSKKSQNLFTGLQIESRPDRWTHVCKRIWGKLWWNFLLWNFLLQETVYGKGDR